MYLAVVRGLNCIVFLFPPPSRFHIRPGILPPLVLSDVPLHRAAMFTTLFSLSLLVTLVHTVLAQSSFSIDTPTLSQVRPPLPRSSLSNLLPSANQLNSLGPLPITLLMTSTLCPPRICVVMPCKSSLVPSPIYHSSTTARTLVTRLPLL